jgi:predicted ATP-binding protein involved in virulence
MQIDRLEIRNFNGFELREFVFDPRFNLLVGDNGTGKTSVLDALSIAVGSWFLGIKGYASAHGIQADEVRVVAHAHEDVRTFEKQFPSRISAAGTVMGRNVTWARELAREGGRTSAKRAADIIEAATDAERRVRSGEDVTLPLICTYGCERLWFESSHRRSLKKEAAKPLPSRFDGYRDCIDFNIEESSFLDWIQAEVSAGQQRGRETIAYRVVRDAITACVDGAVSLYYDARYRDLVVHMDRQGFHLFKNLSDGQRIMLSLVGDLARRAVILNPHLGDRALEQTPGVVTIDELDLHLHPNWQRRVVQDLTRTFPALQFIATTHSPQLIGEVRPEQIRLLTDTEVFTPAHSFGLDSSRVLEDVMDAPRRDPSIEALLKRLFDLIDKEDFQGALELLPDAEAELGADDPELTRARALMTFLEPHR